MHILMYIYIYIYIYIYDSVDTGLLPKYRDGTTFNGIAVYMYTYAYGSTNSYGPKTSLHPLSKLKHRSEIGNLRKECILFYLCFILYNASKFLCIIILTAICINEEWLMNDYASMYMKIYMYNTVKNDCISVLYPNVELIIIYILFIY